MGGTQNSEIEKAELGEKSDKCLREDGSLFYPSNLTGWV